MAAWDAPVLRRTAGPGARRRPDGAHPVTRGHCAARRTGRAAQRATAHPGPRPGVPGEQRGPADHDAGTGVLVPEHARGQPRRPLRTGGARGRRDHGEAGRRAAPRRGRRRGPGPVCRAGRVPARGGGGLVRRRCRGRGGPGAAAGEAPGRRGPRGRAVRGLHGRQPAPQRRGRRAPPGGPDPVAVVGVGRGRRGRRGRAPGDAHRLPRRAPGHRVDGGAPGAAAGRRAATARRRPGDPGRRAHRRRRRSVPWQPTTTSSCAAGTCSRRSRPRCSSSTS